MSAVATAARGESAQKVLSLVCYVFEPLFASSFFRGDSVWIHLTHVLGIEPNG